MMNKLAETPEPTNRCPQCDSVITTDAAQCLMCGAAMTHLIEPEEAIEENTVEEAETAAAPSTSNINPETAVSTPDPSPEFVSTMRERQSRAVFLLTAVFAISILILGSFVLRYQGPVNTLAFQPTLSPVPPTLTPTPTATPRPTETPLASPTATLTPTPAPSQTPAPERLHILVSGQTLIGLSLIYNVSPDSIAAANSFNVDTPVQAGQSLVVPWPTATPPLEPVAIDINGESVVADPADCPRHQIQTGESVASVAIQYGLNLDLLLRVNRLAPDVIVQPGQTICIPEIKVGVELPPTPGPSPTPAPTQFPTGPQLLYPTAGTVIAEPERSIMLQWTAVKDLEDAEWYMIEVADLDILDVPPYRSFTRDNAFHLPGDWRPDTPENHTFKWRVSIVQIIDERADGQPIYQYGGRFSQPATFIWLGAIPTPTPTATPSPAPSPTSEP